MHTDDPDRSDRMAAFAAALIEELEISGLTRDALARRIGQSPSAVSAWTKATKEPRPTTVFALEDALGCGPGTLSRTLGYCRCGAPPAVEDALAQDSKLSDDKRRALRVLYRTLVAVEG